MKQIEKKHRLLDDTDLNNINNTFKLFKSEFESSRVEFKSGLDKLKSELQSSREKFEYELKHSREKFEYELKHSREVTDSKIDSTNDRIDSMRWLLGFLVAGMVALLIKTFF